MKDQQDTQKHAGGASVVTDVDIDAALFARLFLRQQQASHDLYF